MIYDQFEISDTNGAVLDFSDLLKIELKNDNVQSFDTGWDEKIIAMTRKPRPMRSWRTCTSGSLNKGMSSNRCLLCTYTGTVQKGKETSYTQVKRMGSRHLEQQTRETRFSSRDRPGEKDTYILTKEKRNIRREEKEIAFNGRQRFNGHVEKVAA